MNPTFGFIGVFIALVMQFGLKPLLEIWVKPDNLPLHDNLIRAMAMVLGAALAIVDILGGGTALPTTGHDWLLLLFGGMVAGVTAMGTYHLVKGVVTIPSTVNSPK